MLSQRCFYIDIKTNLRWAVSKSSSVTSAHMVILRKQFMIRDELHYRANTISYTHKKYVLLDGNLPYICTVTEIPCTIHITNDETYCILYKLFLHTMLTNSLFTNLGWHTTSLLSFGLSNRDSFQKLSGTRKSPRSEKNWSASLNNLSTE